MSVKDSKVLDVSVEDAKEAVLVDSGLPAALAAELDLLVVEHRSVVDCAEVREDIAVVQKGLGVEEQNLVVEVLLRVPNVVNPGGYKDIPVPGVEIITGESLDLPVLPIEAS